MPVQQDRNSQFYIFYILTHMWFAPTVCERFKTSASDMKSNNIE